MQEKGNDVKDIRKSVIKRNILLISCVLLLIAAMTLGISYARLQLDKNNELEFSTNKNNSVYLSLIDNLSSNENNKYMFSFDVANGDSDDSYFDENTDVIFRIFATEFDDGNSVIKLSIDGSVYTATSSEIVKDSVQFSAFGSGYIYTFKDHGGFDVTTALKGGEHSSKHGEVEITTAKKDTTFTLVADRLSNSVLDGNSDSFSVCIDSEVSKEQDYETWDGKLDFDEGLSVILGSVNGEYILPVSDISQDAIVTVSDPDWVTALIVNGELVISSYSEIERDGETLTRPEDVSVKITQMADGKNTETVFILKSSNQYDNAGSFTIVDNLNWYNFSIPIKLKAGSTDTIIDFNDEKTLPIGTRYTIDSVTYLVYEPVQLIVPANKTVSLDLSNLSIEPDKSSINFESASSNINLEYKEIKVLKEHNVPIVLGEYNAELELPYIIYGNTLTYVAEKLSIVNGEEIWVTDNDLKVSQGSDSAHVLLDGTDNSPGTYKVTFTWKNDDINICETSTLFNVFNKSVLLK